MLRGGMSRGGKSPGVGCPGWDVQVGCQGGGMSRDFCFNV